jgi:hypothetical protein
MRIKNFTEWETLDLRRLFTAALAFDEKREGAFRLKKRLSVEVHSGKGRKKVSCATMYGFRIWIVLTGFRRKLMDLTIPEQRAELAWLFVHEVWHNRGFKHRQYPKFLLRFNEEAARDFEWAHDPRFTIRRKGEAKEAVEAPIPEAIAAEAKPIEAPGKMKRDLPRIRYERIVKSIEDKEGKIRRLSRALKKLNVKRKYYERKFKI